MRLRTSTNRALLAAVIVAGAFVCLVLEHAFWPRVELSSPSLGYRKFRGYPSPPKPRRGMYVYVCLPATRVQQGIERGYLEPLSRFDLAVLLGHCQAGEVNFGKQVLAVGGETVRVTPTGLFLDGRQVDWNSPPTRDSQERPIAPLFGEHRVPEGWLWLTADHPRSYDSRYFGPVDARSVALRLEPRW